MNKIIVTSRQGVTQHARLIANNSPPFDEDRSEFCNGCGQHFACANCTATECNSRGESEDERHMLMERDRRWDVEAQSTWGWVEEDNEK